jgi:xanthine/uracil permease
MQLRYDVDERPSFPELLLLGLQWLAIIIPIVVVTTRIVGAVRLDQPIDQVLFMQKTAFLIAVTIAAQVLFGHRLPLVAGPSTALVVGLVASQGFSESAVYTSMMVGGLALAGISATGLFAHVRKLFTPRVVAVILLLIAFTLAPVIINLITGPVSGALPRAGFAVLLTLLMFLASRYLKGVWKSTLVLWAIVAGTGACALLFPGSIGPRPSGSAPVLSFLTHMTARLSLEPGVLFSFLVCYLGLAINDLGSIESVGELIKSKGLDKRLTRGITTTGAANILAGFLGVVGPVNYSLSPGVIAATGCASRFTLLPTALLMVCLAFWSRGFAFISAVPSVVIGSVFLYLMSYQVAAGLVMAAEETGRFELEDGLVMGLPLLLGTVVAFAPPALVASFAPLLRPIAGNGFLVGVVAVLVLEHFVFHRRPHPV